MVLPQAGKATLQDEPAVTLLPEGMVNPPAQESVWVTNSPEQLAKNAAVVESVSKLIEKTASIYATAGWVHSSSKSETIIEQTGKLPDGAPIPTSWVTDSWLLLDENGYLLQGVAIQDTGSPSTFQVSVFKNGVWNNLTLGVSPEAGNTEDITPYRPMDHTVLEQAARDKDIAVLEARDALLGNEGVTEFTITEKQLAPYNITGSSYQLIGTAIKYYLSNKTGLVLQTEQYYISADGEYELIQRHTITITEKVKDPPAEVMKYLE